MELEKLKKIYNSIDKESLNSLEERLLDIAHKAVNIQELDHVITNTSIRSIQDYALIKKNFFYDKGII